MRWKMSASVLVALALVIPAAPAAAMAQAAQPGLNAACQTVERTVYTDIRELVTIDLDTATDEEIEALANRILSVAKAESLPVLPDAIQQPLEGTTDDVRAFLKDGVQNAWATALRVTVTRTLTDAGVNVRAAAQETLKEVTVEAYLAYLNDGLYVARALDCESQPTPTPSVTPSASATAAPSPSATVTAAPGDGSGEGGEGGGLPVTGADTMTLASIGGALLVLGIVGYLIGRRRRSRFVA